MSKHDMHTSINGTPAQWTEAIWRLWYTFVDQGDPKLYDDPGLPSRANYFTARPYQDEWDQGDRKEGFTFVVGRHGRESKVYQVITNGLEPYRTAPQPRPAPAPDTPESVAAKAKQARTVFDLFIRGRDE